MSEEKKYRNFTAADIEKYHKGLLSPKEMNELEKAALDDPFLADALEGYGAVSVNASADISELEKKLKERVEGGKVISMVAPRTSSRWWKIAAAVIIVGGLGFLTFRITSNSPGKEVADFEKKNSAQQPVTMVADSAASITPQTGTVVTNNKAAESNESQKKNLSNKYLNDKDVTVDTIRNNLNAVTSSGVVSSPSNVQTWKSDSVRALKTTDLAKDNYTVLNKPTISEQERESKTQGMVKEKKIANDNFGKGEVHYDSVGLGANYKNNAAVARKFSQQPPTNYFRGRIMDANNNALPFANITNTRDNVGTYADVKGNFTLISPDTVLNVQVRSVGFENKFAQLQNNISSNQVVLRDDQSLADKIFNLPKQDTSRSRRMANVKFEELEPADGWYNYGTYLANNINLPADIKSKEGNRQVELSFEVDKDGSPINIKVEKSLCSECDKEAVRLVKEGPKWKKKSKKIKRTTVRVPFE